MVSASYFSGIAPCDSDLFPEVKKCYRFELDLKLNNTVTVNTILKVDKGIRQAHFE